MKIGFIAPPWIAVPPRSYGGTESVIDRLARGCQAHGHDVLLFTTGDATCPVPRAWVYPHAIPESIGDAAHEVHHVTRAYEVLRDCDIIHDHTVTGPMYASARHPDLRVVTTSHGPFDPVMTDVYRAPVNPVPLIAISEAQAASADLPVTRVIHHGIDVDDVRVGAGDGGYFAFLGRMTPDKGPVQAATVAQEAGVRLLMAAKMAEPRERQYFDAEVRPLLGGQIEYVGEVGPEDRSALLSGAVGLVNPIQWAEPFGLVMIEALAAGTPVLACPRGAAAEIVDHGVTGFLCPRFSQMVDAIPHTASIDRSACRRVVEQRFSTDRMVREHLQLYEELVASAPARDLPLAGTSGGGGGQRRD